MRVLFVSMPTIPSVFSLVPLAWAFRAAGHEVLLGTCGKAMVATDAGLQLVDVAPGFTLQTLMEQRIATDPGLPRRLREMAVKRDVHIAVEVFDPVNRHLVDGTMRLARHWRPQLVVHDQVGAVGVLVAASLGVPAVQQNFGILRARQLRGACALRSPTFMSNTGWAGRPNRR